MSVNKKYYYLKLKDSFFDSEEMKLLESQKNGIEYQNLYLKLCLLSVKSEGKLSFKDCIPYDIPMLSTVLRVNIDTVRVGLELFKKLELVEFMDSGLIYMTDIQALIGRSSTEAERIKKYRESLKNKKDEPLKIEVYKCTPEKEIEIDTETEIEIDTEIGKDEKPDKKEKFIPPTEAEVIKHCLSQNYNVDAYKFIKYYEESGWKKANGKPVKNWKQCCANWHTPTPEQKLKQQKRQADIDVDMKYPKESKYR